MKTAITIAALSYSDSLYTLPNGAIYFFGALICIALVQDIVSLYKK